MPEKKIKEVKLVITKYYAFAWLYGLVGLGCIYYNHFIVGGIMMFFFLSYSIADYQNPPAPIDPTDNDGPEKPA